MNRGMTLHEVLIGAVILAILSPIVHQTYTYTVRVQRRRALHEEVLIYASDYLEYSKYRMIKDSDDLEPFDTVRFFRGDTLYLQREQREHEMPELVEETFQILIDSVPLTKHRHLLYKKRTESLWD